MMNVWDDRPAPGDPAQSAKLGRHLRALAGVARCEWCDQPARNRFASAGLCDDHAAEAMATAYHMETGGAL